tara:strand:- start:481 stop:1056 length:576 start_codon:yes stop_codon:yes gene_type:complete
VLFACHYKFHREKCDALPTGYEFIRSILLREEVLHEKHESEKASTREKEGEEEEKDKEKGRGDGGGGGGGDQREEGVDQRTRKIEVSMSVHGELDEASTMLHFINADMVVESGSSFTSIAHLVAHRPVFLSTCEKENQDETIYDVSEDVKFSCSDNGLMGISRDEFEAYVRGKYFQYNDEYWPRSYREYLK